MSLNSYQINLNSNIVLSDRENDLNVADSEVVRLTEPLNSEVFSIERVISGVDENMRCEAVVDGLSNEGLEIKSESFDRGNDVEVGMGSMDRGIGVPMTAIDEEVRTYCNEGGSEGGRVGNGVFGTEAEQIIDRQELGMSFCDEKVENCAQVEEIASGEVEGDQDVKLCPVEGALFDQRECVTGKPSSTPSEDISQAEHSDAVGSINVNVKPHSSGVAESAGDVLGDVSGMGVQLGDTDEASLQGDPSTHVSEVATYRSENQAMEIDEETKTGENRFMSLHVSEAAVSHNTGDDSNAFNLVRDLNPYLNSDGNSKSAAGIGNEGTKFKDVSGNVRIASDGENAASHANGFGLDGNQHTSDGEHVMDIQQSNENQNKLVKLAAAKSGFCVSDLVWGKVRSHPWWPGQIFDHSASSTNAKKYYKKDGYLIAYFGDETFAWNEASKVKPFRAHFSPMGKQSSSEGFRHAVDCALDEVSRRVEFGLACACIPEGVYARIKNQIVVNAGIQEESSRREGGDSLSSAVYFKPVKLVEHVKALAGFPYGGVDRLEHVIAQAQLLAFYRWKGYPQLPEFKMLGGLLENDANILLSGDKKHSDEMIKDAGLDLKSDKRVPSGKGKLGSEDNSSLKRKRVSRDSTFPSKKEKSLLDLMAEYSESRSKSKVTCKLISSSCKKRKVVDVIPNELAMKRRISHSPAGVSNKSSQSKQEFRVGDSILRVANQLNGSTSSLKCGGVSSQKTVVSNKGKEKPITASFGVSSNCSQNLKISRSINLIPTDYSSPGEMLSQLCLAAQDPLKGYTFGISIVNFFSEFRNSVTPDLGSSQEQTVSLQQVPGTTTWKESTKLRSAETSEWDHMRDSHWTDTIVEGILEKQSLPENHNRMGEFLTETRSKKDIPTVEQEAALDLCPNMDFEDGTAGGNPELEAEKPVGDMIAEDILGKQSLYENHNKKGEFLTETRSKKDLPTVEQQAALDLCPNMDFEEGTACGNPELEAEKSVGDMKVEDILEKQSLSENHNKMGQFLPENISKKEIPTVEQQAALDLCPSMDSEDGTAGGNPELKAEKSVGDMIVEGILEKQSLPENHNKMGEFLPETTSKKDISTVEQQAALDLCPNMDSEAGPAVGNPELEAENPVGRLEESFKEDISPTALILNFRDLASVPSKTNLNKIFSCFGPLNESGTEVLKRSCRGKVIFKRRSDAETAFSSAGKYSSFGPSLVSYRLKYLPSTPSKASPHATRRSKKEATSGEGKAS